MFWDGVEKEKKEREGGGEEGGREGGRARESLHISDRES